MIPNISYFMKWRLPISVSCFFLVPTFRRKLGKKLAATSTSCRQKFSFSEAAFLLSVLIRGSGCYECKDGINQHLSDLWTLTLPGGTQWLFGPMVFDRSGFDPPISLAKLKTIIHSAYGQNFETEIVKSVCIIYLSYGIWVPIRSSTWMYYLVFIARILQWNRNAY